MTNDLMLQRRVEHELAALDWLHGVDVGVETHHGVVKLAGRSDDVELQRHLRDTVEHMNDVRQVVMDFTIARC